MHSHPFKNRASSLASFAALGVAIGCAAPALAASVTGNPVADGWTYGGHSLANGSYVRGSANYGFDMYSTSMSLTAGSNLVIADGANSWNVGDTVLGMGGRFQSITADEAGWTDFTGGGVNSLLGAGGGPKLQVKFGTATSAFTASSVAPNAGDGDGSLSFGGAGAVQIRTSGYNEASYWAANSGQVMNLQSGSHIERFGGPNPIAATARMIWEYDAQTGKPISWQILLNVSLLEATTPGDFSGLFPTSGVLGLMTVQNGDNAYTDGMLPIAPIPAPGAVALLGLAGLAGSRRRRN